MKLSQILNFPNQLTLMRMMFVPFIVIKLVEGHYSSALILFVLAGLSDGLDGLLARTLKQQTVLGRALRGPGAACFSRAQPAEARSRRHRRLRAGAV